MEMFDPKERRMTNADQDDLQDEWPVLSVTHRKDRSAPSGWFIDSQYVSQPPACFHEVLKKLGK
jgi:hypothetical protein